MTRSEITPQTCRTMEDVRAGIDALDEKLVALLAERMRYIEAASRIKTDRTQVRDEDRKAAVLAHAAQIWRRESLPEHVILELYERLVELSIAYEEQAFVQKQD